MSAIDISHCKEAIPYRKIKERKLTHVRELPEWFTLQDYAIGSEFGLAQWCEQFSLRVCWAKNYYRMSTDRFMSYQTFKRSRFWFKYIQRLSQQSVPDYAALWQAIDRERRQYLKQPFHATDSEGGFINAPIVKAVSQYDFYTAYWDLPATDADKVEYQRVEGVPSRAVINKQLSQYRYDNPDDPLNQPYDDAIVELDLMADDHTIINDVKQYIAQVRAKQGDTEYYVRNNFRTLDFQRWHRNHLLACADLLIWGLYHQTILSDSILSEALDLSYDRYCRCVRPEIKQLYKIAGFLTARYTLELSRRTSQ